MPTTHGDSRSSQRQSEMGDPTTRSDHAHISNSLSETGSRSFTRQMCDQSQDRSPRTGDQWEGKYDYDPDDQSRNGRATTAEGYEGDFQAKTRAGRGYRGIPDWGHADTNQRFAVFDNVVKPWGRDLSLSTTAAPQEALPEQDQAPQDALPERDQARDNFLDTVTFPSHSTMNTLRALHNNHPHNPNHPSHHLYDNMTIIKDYRNGINNRTREDAKEAYNKIETAFSSTYNSYAQRTCARFGLPFAQQ